MKIKITSISDRGDIRNERIGMAVSANCDLKYFLLFQTRLTETGFFQKSKNSFWFAPLEVKANDKIVIYTREGKYSVKEENNITIHFFYWGLSESILSDDKHGVVLCELNSWQVSRS